MDISRGNTLEKSSSRVCPSASSDDDDLHRYTHSYTFQRENKKFILFFLALPQAIWKREQKHTLCLKVAKSFHRNSCPGSLGTSPRDWFSRNSPKCRRKRNKINKERRLIHNMHLNIILQSARRGSQRRCFDDQ